MMFDCDDVDRDVPRDYSQYDDLSAFLCEQPDWFLYNLGDRLRDSVRGKEVLHIMRKHGASDKCP